MCGGELCGGDSWTPPLANRHLRSVFPVGVARLAVSLRQTARAPPWRRGWPRGVGSHQTSFTRPLRDHDRLIGEGGFVMNMRYAHDHTAWVSTILWEYRGNKSKPEQRSMGSPTARGSPTVGRRMTWREWPIASERLNRRSDGRATEHHPIHARRSMHASGARRHTSRPTPSCALMRGREMMEAPHCALRHCAIGHQRTATPKAQQRAQAQATPAPRSREEG